MITKSLYFDFMILRIKHVSIIKRILFIYKKYLAIIRIRLTKHTNFRVATIDMEINDLSGLGTVQSSIVDFYNDIFKTSILKTPEPFIVDIGANIGQFCNAAKLYFPNAYVYSYEPNPNIFRELSRNTASLSRIKLFNTGLGNTDTELPFYIHTTSGMSSFTKYADHNYDSKSIVKLDIKKLDNLLITKKRINLLKIDVEGFEIHVLEGAVKTLNKTDYLLLELSLGRSQAANTNIGLLNYLYTNFPQARIIKFGRPLGDINLPSCQDILIKLNENI